MNTFARAFTVRSVVAWPTILVAVIWSIVANLGDSSYNGTQFPLQRGLIVALFVLSQFGLTWLADFVLLRHFGTRTRALGLFVTFIAAGWLRGVGIALAMFAIGASPEVMLAGRIIAASIQTFEISLLALAYGVLIFNARQLRELSTASAQLTLLAEQAAAVREADDVALIEQVRAQLRKSLNWADDATPDDVLATLHRSIDELVRPLSRALTKDAHHVEPMPAQELRVDWRTVWRNALDSDQLRLGWAIGVLVFILAVPSASVFGAWGIALAVAMAVVLWATMSVTRWAVRFAPMLRRKASPIVLITGSLAVMSMFWMIYPSQLRLTYVIITPFTLSLATLVPTLMTLALAQATEIASRLENENQRLRWSIARTNEITRQRRATVSSALHGSVQAALASTYLRLQIALRDGADPSVALASARADSERAVTLAVEIGQGVPSTDETLNEIALGWAGVTELRTDVTSATIDADPIAAQLLADLVTESVLNAVKHAGAAWVEISAKVNADQLELLVRNPAIQPLIPGEPGGGTRLLERSTIAWSRHNGEGITSLTASIPYEPSEGKPSTFNQSN